MGRSRWTVLAVFTLVAGLSQALWLNFVPILSTIQRRYGVDELTASTLILVFPALYVVLSLPAGALIDRRGYRFSVAAGAVVMAAFACLRIYTGSFYVLLAGQIGIACAQPYIVNGISKLVADWFPPDQNAAANGLGTVGLFIGMALGMGLTPELVDSLTLTGAMVVFALLSVVGALLFLLLGHEQNPSRQPDATIFGESRALLRDRNLLRLFVVAFLALGYFNGLTTWLELILAPRGINSAQAGLGGAALIVGGIVGAAVVPTLSDRFRRRKPFLMLCSTAALLLTYPLCYSTSPMLLYALGAALGAAFLPGYALLLAMTEEEAGAARAGAATGVLMLTGNAGGVVVSIAMQVVKGDGPEWRRAVLLLLGMLIIALGLASLVRETFGRREPATPSGTAPGAGPI